VLALELLWELDARRSNTQHVDAHHAGGQQGRLELRTAQATQDMLHLQRLLGEQLARVTLPAPVLYLRMRTLQTQALGGESHSLLLEDLRPGDSLHQMLERLRARLGAQQVLCVEPMADHRPEHMQRWQPWSAQFLQANQSAVAPESGAAHAMDTRAEAGMALKGQFPTWLLPTPLALPLRQQCPWYEGALTLLAGPQRLEAGWLEGEPALRDYFVARSEKAGLVWIFRERQGLRWYLHGLFA
jgi:protein ImuB